MGPPRPKTVIRIKRLSRNVLQGHIDEIFSQYGNIVHLEFPMNSVLHVNRGMCVVEFSSEEEALQAKRCMDGGQLDGNVLQVDVLEAGA